MRDILLLLIGFSLIVLLFARSCYLQKRDYQYKISGIVVNKYKGSRGSLVIVVASMNDSMPYKFTMNPTTYAWKSITVGDSIVKNGNSYYLYFFSLNQNTYIYKDSFDIYHY